MERTIFYDKSLERRVANLCIELLLPSLKNEAYYNAEDKLTNAINKLFAKELTKEFWEQQVIDLLSCYDDDEILELADNEDFLNSTLADIYNDEELWRRFNDIVDWFVNVYKKDKLKL